MTILSEIDFDFLTFPVLETERLVLRQVGHGDATAVLASFGDYEVQKFNGPVLDLDGVHDLLTDIRTSFRDKRGVAWGVTRRGKDSVMGMIGLWHTDAK